MEHYTSVRRLLKEGAIKPIMITQHDVTVQVLDV